MSVATNPLSSISYTNKDFRDIYPELLDIVKKLTYKWDPSISNESDPGVILLKLNAIIGDKNNYNIDKNVLEVFPETLTQEVSARSMYHQLAYEMPWYRSATTDLTFRWTGDDLTDAGTITIPKFTMVCDADSKFIYTLTQDVYFTADNLTTTATAIQGIITDVSVNGDKALHLNNIDHNNRIYLDDYSIAENGIFINNVGENTYWTRVSNLAVEAEGNLYYEFGVDGRTNLCYIQLPDDIDSLIRDGLNIKYVTSDGREGNVASKVLTSFYDDVAVTIGENTVTLTTENCLIYNAHAANNGDNPQEISDAYKSFRKVSGTFDTIVTLRDYMNAIYTNGQVSNVVVSDRGTDVQDSYSIITDSALAGTHVTVVSRNTSGEPSLNAFDLKLYLLQNPGDIGTLSNYESTFEMIPSQSTEASRVQLALKQTRCIAHDFEDIEANLPCLFRIAYPLRIKIVPQYKLTAMQQESVKFNITSALFRNINSRKVEFGEEPSYDTIYDIVATSDDRIKLAIIDDFNYTTFATYWTGDTFKNIPLSNFNDDPYIYYSDADSYDSAISNFTFTAQNSNAPEKMYFVCNFKPDGSELKNAIYVYNTTTKSFDFYSEYVDEFRKQIITKSVMAGVTPLFDQEVVFRYTINQQIIDQIKDVSRITTTSCISPFGFKPNTLEPEERTDTVNEATYKLKQNESIQFLAPSFITKRSFSNYVAYQFKKNTPTSENQYVSLDYKDFVLRATKPDLFANTLVGKTVLDDPQQRPIQEYDYYDITSRIYDERTGELVDVSYTTPVFVTNTYYDTNGELVQSDDTQPGGIPEGWNTEGTTYYYDSEGKQPVVRMIYNYSYATAWQKDILPVFWKTSLYTIPANTDYKLQKGDSLILFYTEEQESTAPYTYEKYEVTDTTLEKDRPIIRATFTLNGLEQSSIAINPSYLSDTGYIPFNSASESAYQKVYELFSKYALSGSQSIDIRGMNQVEITKTKYYYYFITNDMYTDSTNKSFYRMIMSKYGTSYTGGDITYQDYQYILKTDEYFIYLNKDKTEFEILGPGTLVRFIVNDSATPVSDQKVFTVEAVDYQLISNKGISAFDSVCKLFEYDAILREQQIYNFSTNDVVKITLDSTYDKTTYPYFKTGEQTLVQGFHISYSSNDSTFTDLPNIDIDDPEAVWSGTAILNIDSTNDTPQVIDNSLTKGTTSSSYRQSWQQMSIAGKDYPTQDEIKANTFPLLYLLTNVAVTHTGGQNIDVTYLTADGERRNLELLIYALNSAFNSGDFSLYNNKIVLKTTEGSHIADNVSLQSGYKYIIGVTNSAASPVTFGMKITKNDVNLLQLLNGDDAQNNSNDLDSSHPWYFKLEGEDLTGLKLEITVKNSDPSGQIVFDDLLKYVDNDSFQANYDITVQDILDKIKTYYSYEKFKYNYIVDPATAILDPIEGNSFFEENHIFNSYAIAEGLLKPPATRSTNDTIISIINNR